jgi:predicted transcriptional regulator
MSTKQKPPKTRLLVFLEADQHAALKLLSETSGAPMNWHIREAVSRYLARQQQRKGK